MPWWWGWWRGGWPRSREPGNRPRHGHDRHRRHVQDRVHRQARPHGAGEGRADLRVPDQRRRDRQRRRNALRRARASASATPPSKRMLSADDWQTDGQAGRADAGDQDARRRAAGRRGQREDLCAASAREGAAGRRCPATSRRATAVSPAARRAEGRPARTCRTRTTGRWARWSPRRASPPTPTALAKLSFKLAAGAYRAVLETQDRFGKKVTGKLPLQVLQPGRHEAGHQDSAICWPRPIGRWSRARSSWRCGAPATRRAGPSSRSNIAHKMIQRFWTEAGPDAAADQAGGDRGDARRLHAARDPGPREPRLPRIAQRRRALDEQGPRREMGALRLQAAAGPEGNVDAVESEVRSPKVRKRREGRRRDGGHALRRVARRLRAAQLAAAVLASSARTTPRCSRSSRTRRCGSSRSSAAGTQPYESVQITYRSFPPDLTANLWGYRFFAGDGGDGGAIGMAQSHMAMAPPRWRMAAAPAPAMAAMP